MSVKGWRIITGIGSVIVAVLIVVATNSPTTIPLTVPDSSLEQIRDRAGAAYVKVPAGGFIMGSDVGDAHAPDDEKPQHEVSLDAFWIMWTEVTNAQYGQCVQADACSPPDNTEWDKPRYASYPVTDVSWFQANDYARWVGGRLPSEAEWEKACRGTEGRTYPWGDKPPTEYERLANFWDLSGGYSLKMVGSYPNGASPYGVLDMSGNVSEWTSSLWGKDKQHPNLPEIPDFVYPYDPADGRENQEAPRSYRRVVRGGAFNATYHYVRCANREGDPPDFGANGDKGFRVAVSVHPIATFAVTPTLVSTATFVSSLVILSGDRMTVTSPIQMQLVRVPAGEFLMGSDPSKDSVALDDEQPQHPVTSAEFYIGKYEVTNDQYQKFAKSAGHGFPLGWKNGNVPTSKEDHPVANVSWDDAVAFTEWLHEATGRAFRLCTETEWEKACRSSSGLTYPWGDTFDSNAANTDEAGIGTTTAVGAYSPAGDSPYGVTDMAGNGWEWVADRYAEYDSATSPTENSQSPQTGDSRVLRGGSFINTEKLVRCPSRSHNNPNLSFDYIGFRVCVSPGP